MKYRAGTDVAFGTPDVAAATKFYSEVFGFEPGREIGNCKEVKAGPITFYLAPDQTREPCFVIEVDDVAKAESEFLANGCEKLDWTGNDDEIFVRDPFGYAWCVERTRS